jgi:hypothetical protein
LINALYDAINVILGRIAARNAKAIWAMTARLIACGEARRQGGSVSSSAANFSASSAGRQLL